MTCVMRRNPEQNHARENCKFRPVSFVVDTLNRFTLAVLANECLEYRRKENFLP